MSRRHLQALLDCTAVQRVWHGVYSRGWPDEDHRLRGLDLSCGEVVAVCLGTAARRYGFDTEDADELHVLNPVRHQLRPAEGLTVHRRDGAPLTMLNGRPTTSASWTAIEVARTLRRPRALATLDAALRSGHCDAAALSRAAADHSGRRGIVVVRDLLELADGRAESPMESEARLVMIDGGLPPPDLQYQIIDGRGRLQRFDFAWPDRLLAAEYDSEQWHAGADAWRRDREKWAAVQEIGWTVVPILRDDVRVRQREFVDRMWRHLGGRRAA